MNEAVRSLLVDRTAGRRANDATAIDRDHLPPLA